MCGPPHSERSRWVGAESGKLWHLSAQESQRLRCSLSLFPFFAIICPAFLTVGFWIPSRFTLNICKWYSCRSVVLLRWIDTSWVSTACGLCNHDIPTSKAKRNFSLCSPSTLLLQKQSSFFPSNTDSICSLLVLKKLSEKAEMGWIYSWDKGVEFWWFQQSRTCISREFGPEVEHSFLNRTQHFHKS